jgi:hypothetical protein
MKTTFPILSLTDRANQGVKYKRSIMITVTQNFKTNKELGVEIVITQYSHNAIQPKNKWSGIEIAVHDNIMQSFMLMAP